MDNVEKIDVQDALALFKAKTDEIYLHSDSSDTFATKAELANIAISGGGLMPIVKVSSTSGATVTLSKDNTTLTASENNGVWLFNVSFGDWTVHAVLDDYVIFHDVVSVDSVKIYDINTDHKRYGYRMPKTGEYPYENIEYLYCAVGKKPAHMVFDSDTPYFDYGDWADAWFITDNKPCMLTPNGAVACFLDPNDYSKKEDGSSFTMGSDNTNAMAQMPLCWVHRYEDDDYYYEIVANYQHDENYKAYAHTDAQGLIRDYFYFSIYTASNVSNVARSLSGNSTFITGTSSLLTAVKKNGPHWNFLSWSQHELLRTLLTLISKTASFTPFGLLNGSTAVEYKSTGGSFNSKGQFYGVNDSNTFVIKCFHSEAVLTHNNIALSGAIKSSMDLLIKLTPEGSGYSLSDFSSYTYVSSPPETATDSVSQYSLSEFGAIPIKLYDAVSSPYNLGSRLCWVSPQVTGCIYVKSNVLMVFRGAEDFSNSVHFLTASLSYV